MFSTATASPSTPALPQVASASNAGNPPLTLDSFNQQPPVTGVIHHHQPCSPVSTTSAFLLGIHNYKALEDVNLPEYVREHQTTLTFPEKLMLMLTYVDKEYPGKEQERCCVSWALGGHAFVIRSKEDICKEFLPLFFRQAKFASFTRKLYRWGFRQVSVHPERPTSNRREMIFGHELFQRDNKSLMAGMRSVTAAGTRRAVASVALKKQKAQAQSPEKLVIEPKGVQDVVLSVNADKTGAPQFNPGSPSKNLAPRPVKYFPGAIGNHSLQDALTYSQQKGSFLQATMAPMATIDNKSNGGTSSSDSTMNSANKDTPNVVKQAGPTTSTSRAMNQLKHSFQATAQQQAAEKVPNKSESGDPNAYMRAAIDMLLRYAS